MYFHALAWQKVLLLFSALGRQSCYLNIYGREGTNLFNCASPIPAGRGGKTFFFSHSQKHHLQKWDLGMTIHKGAYVSVEVGIQPKVILRAGCLYWQDNLYRKRGGKKDHPHLRTGKTTFTENEEAKKITHVYCQWLLGQASLTRTAIWVCRKLTCAPLSSSSSTVISADVPFSLTVECLPCQKKYTHFSFPTALTCCSPFCLLPTAKQKAHAEESTLAIGLNSTWFNLVCQLSTIPSRTGKIKCPIGGTLGLQASTSPCKVGIVSSGGCKPTCRDACVGQRKRCRKNWYYLEKNN